MEGISSEQLHFLLECAIQAPSADNRHPFRFRLGDQSILIHHAQSGWGELGYKRVLSLLSLGAIAENLCVAASRFGLGAEASLLPDPDQPDLVLRIRFLGGEAQTDMLWRAIPLRHTNRQLLFRGPSLSADEREQLDAAALAYPACQLRWFDAAAERRPVLALMRRAEAERFRNPLLHRELFSAIRFDVGWRRTCEEGLPPGALGVEPPLRGLFALLRHWPLMRLANGVGAHHLLGWRACGLPCRLAPSLGLLAVKKTDSVSIFAAGRAFQRLWLTATSQGRVLQPMPAAALYAMDGAVAQGIPEGLHQMLAEGWEACLGAATPLMIFRMGRADTAPITAGRPPVETFFEMPAGVSQSG